MIVRGHSPAMKLAASITRIAVEKTRSQISSSGRPIQSRHSPLQFAVALVDDPQNLR